MNNNDERDYAEEAANAALMREGDEDPYVDRVSKCQICGGLIEHYTGDPANQWRHVEVRNHTPEKKPTHETSIKHSAGGYDVSCSCGQWSGVAPALWIAERDAARHELEAKS